jgi:membrane protease subunit HflK
VIPRGKGTASRLLQEAEGYKQRVIANSEGDASRFKQVLAEYAKAPGVTRERIYIETIQQVLSSTNKIMLDYKGPGNLLFLPLDKLMGGGAAETVPQQRAAPAEPAAPEGPRSRDSLRSRDRGDRG